MAHTIVCLGCERALDAASNMLRRHASQMNTALSSLRNTFLASINFWKGNELS